MADTTLGLTFDTLRTRVAEYLGIAYYGAAGDTAAAVPVDVHDLELVGRIVNDGYARFLTENKGKWNFLTVPLNITFLSGTVSADNSRYYLPDDFMGVMLSPFTYSASGPRIKIEMVPEYRIRELIAGANTTGQPSVAAVRAINTDATASSHRWEVIFWPTPSAATVVTALYKRFPQALSSASDRSVAGFQHDRTVLASALAAAELQRGDAAGPREAAYQMALTSSVGLDARAASPRGQDYGDKSEDNSLLGRRPLNYYGVNTYNGVSIE